jgi:hypothetical protein
MPSAYTRTSSVRSHQGREGSEEAIELKAPCNRMLAGLFYENRVLIKPGRVLRANLIH